MKNFRKKAAPAIVLLAGASMSLAGVTFAWFNQNTNANVSKINVGVVDASGGVAVSDEAEGIYKTSLDFNDATGSEGAEKHTFGKLDPISTNGDLNSGKDMFKFYKGVLSKKDTSKITSGEIDEGYETFDLFFENVSGNNRYVYFDYTNLSGYSDASKYSLLMNEIFGADNASQYSFRIGFINLGTTSGKADAKKPTNEAIIVEPDWHNHTNVAKAAVPALNGFVQDDTYALIGSFTDDSAIRPNGDVANKMEKQVAYKVDECNFNDKLDRPLFTIKQGYTQIRVVMWLEGQDIDNDNSVSGIPFSVNLKFNTKVVDIAVEDAQTEAKSELNNYKVSANKGEDALATTGATNIDSATSVVAVKDALKVAENNIKDLRDARADALTKLSAYIGDWAPIEGDSYKTAYETALADGQDAINNAETVAAIGTTLTAEKANIKTVALAGAEVKAIGQLKAYKPDVYTRGTETVETFNFENYTYTSKETSINSSTDFEDLTAKFNAAKAEIDADVLAWINQAA